MKVFTPIKLFGLGLAYLLVACSSPSSQKAGNSVDSSLLAFQSLEETKEFFNWKEGQSPLISAHRGGSYPGYPENAIETFQYVLDHSPVIIECDISMSKDSVLLMMHDNTVNRTTNGNGEVSKMRWDELEDLKLVDEEGTLTDYEIPTLEEVLIWAKGRTVLTLDIKRGVPYEKIIETIRRTRSEASVALITYSLDAARKLNHLAPDLMLSVTIRNEQELSAVLASGIPKENIIAFTGLAERSAEFNQQLHLQGIFAILGVLGNLDKRAEARGDKIYRDFVSKGADILATDRPIEVAESIY